MGLLMPQMPTPSKSRYGTPIMNPCSSRKPKAKQRNHASGVFLVRTIPLILSVIEVYEVWLGPSSDTGGR